MKYVNYQECEASGLEPKKVEAIARRISRACLEAKAMGITLFAGGMGYPGTGDLRFYDSDEKGALIVAELDGSFDGGDGGPCLDPEGLKRGEHF